MVSPGPEVRESGRRAAARLPLSLTSGCSDDSALAQARQLLEGIAEAVAEDRRVVLAERGRRPEGGERGAREFVGAAGEANGAGHGMFGLGPEASGIQVGVVRDLIDAADRAEGQAVL